MGENTDIRNAKLAHIPQGARSSHIYCEICGLAMVAGKSTRLGKHNKITGIKGPDVDIYTWSCPSGHSGHDYLEFD